MTDETADEINREQRGHVFYPPADAVAMAGLARCASSPAVLAEGQAWFGAN